MDTMATATAKRHFVRPSPIDPQLLPNNTKQQLHKTTTAKQQPPNNDRQTTSAKQQTSIQLSSYPAAKNKKHLPLEMKNSKRQKSFLSFRQ